jgi:histidine triad (HIT) family protein
VFAGRAAAEGDAKPCIFCEIVAGARPAAIVYRDELVLAFLDHAPRNPGHVLIVPVVHAADLVSTPAATAARMTVVAQRIARAIRRADLRADGFNFIANTGGAAGQMVFHAHLHVMPRVAGDAGLGAPRERVAMDVLAPVAARIRAALAVEVGETAVAK